jgi:hypothetical protein
MRGEASLARRDAARRCRYKRGPSANRTFCCSALMRIAFVCGGFALALTTGGCALGALELAPMALQAVEAVGSGVTGLAEATTISHHQTDSQENPENEEVCDDLSTEIPMLVELRTDKSGATRYRDLSLAGADLDPQWAPMPNQQADATGWVQAGNFTKMDFQPPLQSTLTPDSVTYVAYAPADAHDVTEQGQLNALNIAFGPQFGTFRFNNRTYRYSAVHKLPCFPPPHS